MAEMDHDNRVDNVAIREEHPETEKIHEKRTNNIFKLENLPEDYDYYDEDEQREYEESRKKALEDEANRSARHNRQLDATADDEGSDEYYKGLADSGDGEAVPDGAGKLYYKRRQELLQRYEYNSCPVIPAAFRGANIIGLRTTALGSTDIPLGTIAPKKKLRAIWSNLTDVEKYILMLISEHRHLTADQLGILIVEPTVIRHFEDGGNAVLKPYYEWVTKTKYEFPLNYKETHKTGTQRGLAGKITHLVELALIEEIVPSYKVRPTQDEQYNRTPSLFTSHYYLTPLGGKVLVCNTAAIAPSSKKSPKHVGYVSSYRSAAYQSIVHETETNDVMCSIIKNLEYMSNMVGYEGMDEDGNPIPVPQQIKDQQEKFGTLELVRFYHEKDCEEKYVPFTDPDTGKNRTIDFKTDGKLTVYSSVLEEFLDFFLEYDSGSSSSSNITHKIEAYVRYVLWKMNTLGDTFRRPIMLLVSQQPAVYMPNLKGRSATKYTKGIEKVKELVKDYDGDLNDIATVLVADTRMIRNHGALGACWHKIDMNTGIPSEYAYDLIEASRPAIVGR